MRTPGLLYQERGADSVSNLFNIKIANKTNRLVPLTLELQNIDGRIETIGMHGLSVKAGAQASGSFFVVLPARVIHQRKLTLEIHLYDGDQMIDVIKTNFLGPVNN